MNQNLGKIILFLFLNIIVLAKETFIIKSNASHYFSGEKFIIDIKIEKNKNYLYSINIIDNIFRIKELSIKESDNNIKYKYLVESNQVGVHKLLFECEIRAINLDAQRESTIGLMSIKDVELTRLVKKVKLSKNIEIKKSKMKNFGNFKLNSKIDTITPFANEPLLLDLELEGIGSLKELDIFKINIDGVNILYGDLKKSIVYSDKISYHITQQIALSAEHNFKIPAISIIFDDKTIQSKAYNIKVKKSDIIVGELLDNKEETRVDYFKYFIFLAIFIFGVVIGKYFKLPQKKIKKQKIIVPTTPKELLRFTLSYKELEIYSLELEAMIYRDKDINFKILRDKVAFLVS